MFMFPSRIRLSQTCVDIPGEAIRPLPATDVGLADVETSGVRRLMIGNPPLSAWDSWGSTVVSVPVRRPGASAALLGPTGVISVTISADPDSSKGGTNPPSAPLPTKTMKTGHSITRCWSLVLCPRACTRRLCSAFACTMQAGGTPCDGIPVTFGAGPNLRA
ncbi:hypothetical protein LZ32DRAFT_365199 [Colletotrichum eremochloae]|nr:hypothetical protein LZ32DRAFT_365199 [Colletotrichum eremochloae]